VVEAVPHTESLDSGIPVDSLSDSRTDGHTVGRTVSLLAMFPGKHDIGHSLAARQAAHVSSEDALFAGLHRLYSPVIPIRPVT
jgi:hypothetical protein